MSKAEEVERNALKIMEGIVINHTFPNNVSSKERLCTFAGNEFLCNLFYSCKCVRGCK